VVFAVQTERLRAEGPVRLLAGLPETRVQTAGRRFKNDCLRP
jgi:hypothetical protein